MSRSSISSSPPLASARRDRADSSSSIGDGEIPSSRSRTVGQPAAEASRYTGRDRADTSSATGREGSGGGSCGHSASEEKSGGSSAGSRIRRRNRMITSCLECRRRKLKCDRLHPCGNCSRFKRDCLFLAPALDSASRMKLTELKERMNSLERVLERDAATRQARVEGKPIPGSSDSQVELEEILSPQQEGVVHIPDDEKDLKPTPLAIEDATYEDEADDDTFDLGFKLGKLRMTDRIGGFFRPRIVDELSLALGDLNVADPNVEVSKQVPSIKPPRLRELLPEEKDSFFNPGPSYIAPRSDLFFGGGRRRYSLADFLPTRVAADRLLQQYWEAVDPVAKIVHRPTFEKQYETFWSDVGKGLEPVFSLQAVIFASLFAAAISMSEPLIFSTFGVPQKGLVENFQLGTEMALGKAQFLKTTKTQTLQALVMYLIPMCRNEVSRAHSALVGAAIRLAECMGFHRDPEEYALRPIETHVRRMVWYQLCFLDMRTSETQGPRQSIRREDFSTKFPLNVDDCDFSMAPSVPLSEMSKWTDVTFTRIRFECNELHRLLYVDRLRLEKKEVSLTQVLGKIEAFRKATYAKYGQLIDFPHSKPIQRAARLVLSILMCRAYIAVLHRYHNSVTTRIPDRLRQIILTSGTQLLEDAIELETAPELQPWAWYSGAINQYHTALLLLFEVYLYPMRREADRIWRCLDYVFETSSTPFQPATDDDREMSRRELIAHRNAKARYILLQLRDRMTAYREMRKPKVPISMNDTLMLWPRGAGDSEDPTLPVNQKCVHPDGVPSEAQGGFPAVVGPSVNPARGIGRGNIPSPSPQPIRHPIIHPPQQGPQQQSEPQRHLPKQHQQQPPLYHNVHSQSLPQTYQSYDSGPHHTILQHPQPLGYNTRGIRGQSIESDTTGSSDPGTARPWFLSPAADASAGAAPPAATASGALASEDLPMLDIDWNEWDKLFPPDTNDGNINLPPLSLPSASLAAESASFSHFTAVAPLPTEYPSYPYHSGELPSTSQQQPLP